MAKDHRRLAEEVAQGILLDDPGFLKEIVERVLQELLEAEMTEHIGAAPYERSALPAPATATATSRGRCAPGLAPSTCSSLRIGKGPSPQDSSPATSETRRRSCWP